MMRWPTWLRRREGHEEDRSPAALAHAYLDDALTPTERAAFETEDEASDALASARALKHLLSALPEEPAPRSFAITPEMLGTKPAATVHREPNPGLMRLSQVAAGIGVFGLMVVGISTLGSGSSDGDNDAAAPASTSIEMMSASEPAADDADSELQQADALTPAAEGTPASSFAATAAAAGPTTEPPGAGSQSNPSSEDGSGDGDPAKDETLNDADTQRNSAAPETEEANPEDFAIMSYDTEVEDENDRFGWRTWSALTMGLIAIAGIAGWTVLSRKGSE